MTTYDKSPTLGLNLPKGTDTFDYDVFLRQNFNTLDSSLADIVTNVKFPPYNAKGDGVTDDTQAIQKAINDVQTVGSGTVYFPPGTYNITNLQVTSKYVKLKGAGSFTSTLIGISNQNMVEFLGSSANTLYSCEISSLSLQMTNASNYALNLIYIAFSRLEDVVVKGNATYGSTSKLGGINSGIRFEGSYMVSCKDVRVTDCIGWGIEVLDFSPDIHFFHCTTERNGSGGWHVEGSYNTPIINSAGQTLFMSCISQNQPIAYYIGGYTGNINFLGGCHSENISDTMLKIIGKGTSYGTGVVNGVTVIGCNLYASGADTTPMTNGLIDIDNASNIVFMNNYMRRKGGTEFLIRIGSGASNVTFYPNFEEFLTARTYIQDPNKIAQQIFNSRIDVKNTLYYSLLSAEPTKYGEGTVAFSDGTSSTNSFGKLGSGLYRWRDSNGVWTKMGGMVDMNVNATPSNGTSGVYGGAWVVNPSTGYQQIELKKVKVTWSGTFGGSETHTIKIQANYQDGTNAFVEKSATAIGSTWLTDDDIATLIKDSTAINSINVYAKSSLASSSVSKIVQILGKSL